MNKVKLAVGIVVFGAPVLLWGTLLLHSVTDSWTVTIVTVLGCVVLTGLWIKVVDWLDDDPTYYGPR